MNTLIKKYQHNLTQTRLNGVKIDKTYGTNKKKHRNIVTRKLPKNRNVKIFTRPMKENDS